MMLLSTLKRQTVLSGSARRTLSSSCIVWKHTYQDPFPNLSIRHSPDMDVDTPYPNLPPIPRPNEPEDKKRARLIYQSRKRGTLENDLLLSTFAQKYLPTFTMQQLEEYDSLLDEPDWDLFYWATFKKPHPEKWKDSKVLKMICEHAKNKDKKVLRMPDLKE
ncbi:Flavinator of succinate dehydrogenase-domain-containing protein [Halteromyces radiatus]|uniref:Flavinator of succinate dehydrogenase-domain-containing protein n=1 Tax=Halteromyces radiatus TaxID=101107 RepID=UPI00221F8AAC|nr:Flavinator of succinate dehydrogenase-domain-containing protein [Halteromyces radiatus]KAI8088953.1 Flavinator of succinate dehydrogenase-domain-containing protein [Halteromyces radiatus]